MEVLLFGSIAEKAGAARIDVEAASVSQLRERLAESIAGIDLGTYAIAVDHRIVPGDMPLTGREEIAVLPPFAGG
ncbi:MAG: MoaD/ThiS family protein [Flavobacteriales bacterium]|nr:MoaD/ThiS family protein [Flavobacteriales bacterium]